MKNVLYMVVPFLLVFAFFILLLFDVDLPHLVKNIHEATVWGILSLLLIKHLVDIVRKLFEKQLPQAATQSPSLSINPVTTVQPTKTTTKKILMRIAFVLLLMWAAFSIFVQFRQFIPLYNPIHRSISGALEYHAVNPNLINAHIILGDYKGHETMIASSFNIWATIMVSGLNRVVNGSIDWGDGIEEISITNGVNAFKHTYSLSGLKQVKFILRSNGKIIKTVGFDGVPKEEITAEIRIPKGGSVI